MKSNVTKTFLKSLNQLPKTVQEQPEKAYKIYWYWIGTHDEYDELLKRM